MWERGCHHQNVYSRIRPVVWLEACNPLLSTLSNNFVLWHIHPNSLFTEGWVCPALYREPDIINYLYSFVPGNEWSMVERRSWKLHRELTGFMGEGGQGFENSLGGTAQGMANSRALEVGLSSPKRDCLSVTLKATSVVETLTLAFQTSRNPHFDTLCKLIFFLK